VIADLTIGRGPDNDLAVDDPALSRRHAVIETFDGVVQVSDCGSRNGTSVNGIPVSDAAVLRDGDAITLGETCVITVCISGRPDATVTGAPGKQREKLDSGNASSASANPLLNPAIIAITAVTIVLASALTVALLVGDGRKQTPLPRDSTSRTTNDAADAQVPAGISDEDAAVERDPISIEQIEKAAAQVMRRVSSDDRSYVFPPGATRAVVDIKQKVNEYRTSSALSGALGSLTERGSQIAAEARREGVEPYLLAYISLAETDGGRARSDPVATAREVLPRLKSLRATFGTELADKSLIVVAAYKIGGETRRSHPLLATMRRVVKDPQTERNVWYLHEHGGLDDEVYNFVVRFLALGIIAQNPRQFGVAAAPIAF